MDNASIYIINLYIKKNLNKIFTFFENNSGFIKYLKARLTLYDYLTHEKQWY